MYGRFIVQLIADTNYIPVQYLMVEALPATSTSGTEVILETIKVGWDTNENYTKWINHADTTGIQGVLGQFTSATLDQVTTYGTKPTPTVEVYGGHGFYPTANDAAIPSLAQSNAISTTSQTVAISGTVA